MERAMLGIIGLICLTAPTAFAADKIVATKFFPAAQVHSIVAHTEAGRIAVRLPTGGKRRVEAVRTCGFRAIASWRLTSKRAG